MGVRSPKAARLETSNPAFTGCASSNIWAEALKPANVAKMQAAPVTAIVAWDPAFWEALDFLFPHDDRKPLFEGKPQFIHDTGFRNSTLQGAYLMIAAQAMGLDVGAMSGFSK